MAISSSVQAPEKSSVWPTVWTVLVGGLAVLFDTTIVAVGLHTLAGDLHAPVSTIQWVSTGYLLALGVTIPVAGWAQRAVGPKRLWLIAVALFLIGSVLSSLAWSAGALIAFRVIQGIGGGVMLPLMSTLVVQAASGRGIGRVMSVVSLPSALGPIVGPVIGGLVLQHLHWSWIFWINVPFCVAALVLGIIVLPAGGPIRRARFDIRGFVMLAAGLVGLLWGLSNSSEPGGFTRIDVIAPLVLGLLALAAFTLWTLRRARGGALVDLRLLRRRPLASSSILLFLSSAVLYGVMLLLPLYFQEARGATVLESGLLLIPQGLGTLATRSLVGRLSDAVGARWLVAVGFVLVLIGTLPFALPGTDDDLVWLLFGLFIRGAGLGVVTVPLMALGFRGLDREEVPDASVVARISQQIGGAFGTATLAVILAAAATAGRGGIAVAFHYAFWWGIGFTAIGAATSIALPGRPVESPTPGSTGGR